MSQDRSRELPRALWQLSGFADLGVESRSALRGIMERAAEINDMIGEMLREPDNSPIEILNSIECDALYLLGNWGPPDVSNWVIHETWHLELGGQKLLTSLRPIVREAIEKYPPSLSSQPEDIDRWILYQFSALRECINAFYEADRPEAALANKWALDIILGLLATFSTAVRFRE